MKFTTQKLSWSWSFYQWQTVCLHQHMRGILCHNEVTMLHCLRFWTPQQTWLLRERDVIRAAAFQLDCGMMCGLFLAYLFHSLAAAAVHNGAVLLPLCVHVDFNHCVQIQMSFLRVPFSCIVISVQLIMAIWLFCCGRFGLLMWPKWPQRRWPFCSWLFWFVAILFWGCFGLLCWCRVTVWFVILKWLMNHRLFTTWTVTSRRTLSVASVGCPGEDLMSALVKSHGKTDSWGFYNFSIFLS